jgi:hypothetical protein
MKKEQDAQNAENNVETTDQDRGAGAEATAGKKRGREDDDAEVEGDREVKKANTTTEPKVVEAES